MDEQVSNWRCEHCGKLINGTHVCGKTYEELLAEYKLFITFYLKHEHPCPTGESVLCVSVSDVLKENELLNKKLSALRELFQGY